MKRELCGYAGKILRVNLTTKEITEQPIWDYVPKYLGGRGVANKIFWDEVKPGVKALDPENKLIIMTGATTATGIPTGGRIVIAGIAPQCYPEQYAWSGMGGWFGSELKYAGYDGIVLEGALEKPGYLFIDDQTVEIRDALAAGIWGYIPMIPRSNWSLFMGKMSKVLSLARLAKTCCGWQLWPLPMKPPPAKAGSVQSWVQSC